MSKRLSDDEKRVFTDRIQELEAELEGCRKLAHQYITAYEKFALENGLDELKVALTLIGDVAYDRDGYTGDAEKLGTLVDEIYGYARNPQTAVDALADTEEKKEHRRTVTLGTQEFDDLPEYSASLPTWGKYDDGRLLGTAEWKRKTKEGWILGRATLEGDDVQIDWYKIVVADIGESND